MGKLVKSIKALLVPLAVLTGLVLLGLSVPVGGRRALSVQTGSMEPTIKTGSLVFVNRVPAGSIRPGDVITYVNPRNQAQTITHRVQEIRKHNGQRQFVTKGDANDAADKPFGPNRIVGRVNLSVPYVGKAADFARSVWGVLLLVYIPALIVVVSEIRRLAAFYRSQHYVVPELLVRTTPPQTEHVRHTAMFGGLVVVSLLTVTVPRVLASHESSAQITGSIISMAAAPTPPVPTVHNTVQLRRVFTVCDPGATTATSVQIIVTNLGRQAIDISSWTVKSGDIAVVTFPPGTQLAAQQTMDMTVPNNAGIQYSQTQAILRNAQNEQIHQQVWDNRPDRSCRLQR